MKLTYISLFLLILPLTLGINSMSLPMQLYNSSYDLANGSYNFTFAIHNTASSGEPSYTQENSSNISAGLVNIHLTDLEYVNWSEQQYLQIRVNNETNMSPRMPLTASADAMNNPFHYDGGQYWLKNTTATMTGTLNTSKYLTAQLGLEALDQSSFTGGNGKIVTTSGGGAAEFNDDTGNGGTIDFAGNTAALGISRDGVSGGYDYDGAFVFKQKGSNPDGIVEFLFLEESGDWRFALPTSAADHATYNPRSMVVAGPSPNNGSGPLCSYWQFNNLDCDTSGTGADLGVQDDFQVLGHSYFNHSTTNRTTTGTTPNWKLNIDIFDVTPNFGVTTSSFNSIDYNYDFTSQAGSTSINAPALQIDMDYSGGASFGDAINFTPNIKGEGQALWIDHQLPANWTQTEGSVIYANTYSLNPTTAYSAGAFRFISTTNTSSVSLSLQSVHTNKGSGDATGYVGYGRAEGSGAAIGVQGWALNDDEDTVDWITGLWGNPTGAPGGGSPPTNSSMSIKGTSAHALFDRANLYIVKANTDHPGDITLNSECSALSRDGCLFVEGNAQIYSNATINDTLKLSPQSAAPQSPEEGWIYADSDSNELCYYDGTSWTGLKGGGACA